MLAALELRELLAAVRIQVDCLPIRAAAQQHTPATRAVSQAGYTPAACSTRCRMLIATLLNKHACDRLREQQRSRTLCQQEVVCGHCVWGHQGQQTHPSLMLGVFQRSSPVALSYSLTEPALVPTASQLCDGPAGLLLRASADDSWVQTQGSRAKHAQTTSPGRLDCTAHMCCVACVHSGGA
jgi:hypothetical protein